MANKAYEKLNGLGPAVGGWTYGLVPDFPALFPSLIGWMASFLHRVMHSFGAPNDAFELFELARLDSLATSALSCVNKLI